ncbi:uncharacterized protein TRAVEDRAFT_23941 [Trametes versicolor FP-101664 SS1]|uniref:uncharacterized protein n=1 Tax=Trametes versicolor (strain FP-101664) TaxID=717944 RepID=UPI0004622EE3|nr:uncharacterized protein TRAVEDRAFT_23941 [Trametes versicolor FP-101664 SS1]EIW53688.1 hypothetical protein TRAVEDRAFT_23941 [Trametes versicolor FP-101664 SS1]
MDAMLQFVEGIEYLHSKQIAHIDIHRDNLVVGTCDTAAKHESVVKNRIYIIDFDTSRQFSLGPGVQQAITLPGTVQVPPNGLTSFDPYSWDVYCMGRTLEQVIRLVVLQGARRGQDVYQRDEPPHWIAQKYIQWLVGNERLGGCTGVCRCRPTARAALRVLVVLRWAVYAEHEYPGIIETLSSSISTR